MLGDLLQATPNASRTYRELQSVCYIEFVIYVIAILINFRSMSEVRCWASIFGDQWCISDMYLEVPAT